LPLSAGARAALEPGLPNAVLFRSIGREGIMLVVELQRCLNRARYPLPSDHVILCGGGDTTPADVGGEMNVRKADVVGCQRKGSKRQWKEAYDSHTNTKDPVTYKNTSLLYVLVSLLCSLHSCRSCFLSIGVNMKDCLDTHDYNEGASQ
jgi:hypothetical protein